MRSIIYIWTVVTTLLLFLLLLLVPNCLSFVVPSSSSDYYYGSYDIHQKKRRRRRIRHTTTDDVNEQKSICCYSSLNSRITQEVVVEGEEEEKQSSTTTEDNNNNNNDDDIQIIKPNGRFRDTKIGEVSIVTMNVLAPAYNSLAIENWKQRIQFLEEDRKHRVPLAIEMAKQYNADILCLQEVEGGTNDLESELKRLLLLPTTTSAYEDDKDDKDESNKSVINMGYDKFIWSSLLPNRDDNVVGNCIAWRSDRHELVSVDCFKRGMICTMKEVVASSSAGGDETAATATATATGTFSVACVHLPAKPSNIMGRLKTMSNTIQKLAHYDSMTKSTTKTTTKRGEDGNSSKRSQSSNFLDGLVVVAGDFNCDQNSVTAKLLTTGYSPYGNLKDRNYKANVSKASAFLMKHDYRFKDVYEKQRRNVAPVTVSLAGRGPGW